MSSSEFGVIGVVHASIIRLCRGLSDSVLLLSGRVRGVVLPVVRLGELADRGSYSMDSNSRQKSKDGTYRGPFDIRRSRKHELPMYPVLWRHDHTKERELVVAADCCVDIRVGMEEKAAVWSLASRLHHNADF